MVDFYLTGEHLLSCLLIMRNNIPDQTILFCAFHAPYHSGGFPVIRLMLALSFFNQHSIFLCLIILFSPSPPSPK